MVDSSAVVDSGRSSLEGEARQPAVAGGALSLNTRTNRLLWLGVDVMQVSCCSVVNDLRRGGRTLTSSVTLP